MRKATNISDLNIDNLSSFIFFSETSPWTGFTDSAKTGGGLLGALAEVEATNFSPKNPLYFYMLYQYSTILSAVHLQLLLCILLIKANKLGLKIKLKKITYPGRARVGDGESIYITKTTSRQFSLGAWSQPRQQFGLWRGFWERLRSLSASFIRAEMRGKRCICE